MDKKNLTTKNQRKVLNKSSKPKNIQSQKILLPEKIISYIDYTKLNSPSTNQKKTPSYIIHNYSQNINFFPNSESIIKKNKNHQKNKKNMNIGTLNNKNSLNLDHVLTDNNINQTAKIKTNLNINNEIYKHRVYTDQNNNMINEIIKNTEKNKKIMRNNSNSYLDLKNRQILQVHNPNVNTTKPYLSPDHMQKNTCKIKINLNSEFQTKNDSSENKIIDFNNVKPRYNKYTLHYKKKISDQTYKGFLKSSPENIKILIKENFDNIEQNKKNIKVGSYTQKNLFKNNNANLENIENLDSNNMLLYRKISQNQDIFHSKSISPPSHTKNNLLNNFLIDKNTNNLMVNYNIIDIKNNINNINNNSNHYCYTNYLLSPDTKNKIIDIKNSQNFSQKFPRDYFSNSSGNLKKNKIIDSKKTNNVIALCKKINLYRKNNQNSFLKDFNYTNPKIHDFNIQKKESLSPSMQLKHQKTYFNDVQNYKDGNNICVYNKVNNNNNSKYNNIISNEKYNYNGKCPPSHFSSTVNNINNFNYSNTSNTNKDIISDLSLLKKKELKICSKVTENKNIKNLNNCLCYNSNNNENIHMKNSSYNLQNDINNSLNKIKNTNTEYFNIYSGKAVKELVRKENYTSYKILHSGNIKNNLFNNTNPNLNNNNVLKNNKSDSHFDLINQNNSYNIHFNTNNKNNEEINNLTQKDIGIRKSKIITLKTKNINIIYNHENNNLNQLNVHTSRSKTNNFMTQTTSNISSTHSKETIQCSHNIIPIYKKPNSIGKISRKDSDLFITTKKLNKIYEGFPVISEIIPMSTAVSPSSNEKILHYSKSDFFDNTNMNYINKNNNKISKNKITEKNKELLLKRINNVIINDNLKMKNLKKKINVTVKQNYCFISKIYSYFIVLPKISQCIYIKYNPNDHIIQKPLYNERICFLSKIKYNKFTNKNLSARETINQKSITFGDNYLNDVSVNYHNETSENEDFKFYFSEEDLINSGKKDINNEILNNNTYTKNNLCCTKEKKLFEDSIKVEIFKKKESQTYNKEKYFQDKNLLDGLDILKKLLDKRRNEDKNRKFIAGINKIISLFDNRNKNNLNENINTSILTTRKNETLEKIIKNKFTDRLKTYKKCSLNTYDIFNYDNNKFKDSLINNNINESISSKNTNINISDTNINLIEIKKNTLAKIKTSLYKENNQSNKNFIKETKIFKYEYLLSLKNNNLYLKNNLLSENVSEHLKELSTPIETILIFNYLSENFIKKLSVKQKKNNFRNEIINLTNAITINNFNKIFNDIFNLLLSNKENDSKFFENILILIEIIFDKAIKETCYNFLYAELFSKINLKLIDEFIDQKNTKKYKERNIKFLINEECSKRLSNYKQIEDDKIILVKDKLIGFVKFIDELIIVELIKQQYSFHIFEQLFQNVKKINGEDNKYIYLETCIELLNNIGKNINDKANLKYINKLNSYINDTLGNLVKNNNELAIPGYLKYKIINLIEKNKNGWVDSLYEQSIKFQNYKNNLILFNINNDNTFLLSEDLSDIILQQNEEKKEDLNEKIFESDVLNYIKFYNSKEKSDRYNWSIIDQLMINKKMTLDKIIIFYSKLCKKLITEENEIIILSDYIKNIIEQFSKNLIKKDIEFVHNEMIKYFKNINYIIDDNKFMYKIIGNLLFLLIEKRFYLIKDLNGFLKENESTQINLAIIAKYCIMSSGKFAKKYYNDFKQTKLFIINNLFQKYVTDSMEDVFYYMK